MSVVSIRVAECWAATGIVATNRVLRISLFKVTTNYQGSEIEYNDSIFLDKSQGLQHKMAQLRRFRSYFHAPSDPVAFLRNCGGVAQKQPKRGGRETEAADIRPRNTEGSCLQARIISPCRNLCAKIRMGKRKTLHFGVSHDTLKALWKRKGTF